MLMFMTFLVSPRGYSQDLQGVDRDEMTREIEADIRFLASDALEGRSTGEMGEKVAAEYIAARFRSLGLLPAGENGTFYQSFSASAANPHTLDFSDSSGQTVNGLNVVGMIDNAGDNVIVIGAHYDHLGYGEFFGSLHDGEPAIHNGADDNASGVAVLLQLAEICASQFSHSDFLFIAFSGEERGLWGSNYFVKHPTIDLSNVNYMLNYDMVGRLNEEKKLSINGVGTAPEWMPALEAIAVDGISIVTTEGGVGASDHTSFYFAGIPAVHFFTGQHMDYHKPTDDADLINFEGTTSVTLFSAELIDNLAGTPELTFQQTKDEREASARDFKVTLGVMPDYLYNEGGMRIDGVRTDRPAYNAGLLKGDIIIRMGDLEIEDMEGYMRALGEFEPGQTIDVEVKRDDQVIVREVTF